MADENPIDELSTEELEDVSGGLVATNNCTNNSAGCGSSGTNNCTNTVAGCGG